MSRSALSIAVLALAAPAFADPVPASFTAGVITGGGFPEPSNGAATTMLAAGGSGGGSTGGGLDLASIAASITSTAVETVVSFNGTAEHGDGEPFGGNTSAGTGTYIATTGNGIGSALTLSLTQPANFTVSNLGVGTINFTALTGNITGNILTAGSLASGTYRIELNLSATTAAVQTMNWSMHLTAIPSPGACGLLLAAGLLGRRRR